MPRTRSGLGQGLEALVPPLRESTTIATFARTAAAPRAWQVATLRRRRKGCVFTIAPSDVLARTKRRKLKVGPLLALGALGASGWELVAISRKTFFLKRPAPESES
jgi:hypothetical protein